jgi:hypothetical protein
MALHISNRGRFGARSDRKPTLHLLPCDAIVGSYERYRESTAIFLTTSIGPSIDTILGGMIISLGLGYRLNHVGTALAEHLPCAQNLAAGVNR